MNTVSQYYTLSVTQEHPCQDVPVNTIDSKYKEIVACWTRHLQYTSWQLTKDKQVAEDVVQEAFLALWQHKEKVMPQNPVGWLVKVVHNLSVRYLRDRNIEIRNYNNIRHTKIGHCSDVEEKLLQKEQDKLMSQIIQQLPEQQKLVFHLSKEQGLKRRQIADFLQLSPNTVKVHLARATQFMKEHITCISVYLICFVFYNIFFKGSNTIREEVEYIKKKTTETRKDVQVSKKHDPEKLLVLNCAGFITAIPGIK